MSHLHLVASESDIDSDLRWLRWCSLAEDMLGHDLDGDQDQHGYSIDGAYRCYLEGSSVVEYVLDVQGRKTP